MRAVEKKYWEKRNLVFENKMFAGLTLNEALKLNNVLIMKPKGKFSLEEIYNEYREQEKLDSLRDVMGNLDLGYIRGQERKNKAL